MKLALSIRLVAGWLFAMSAAPFAAADVNLSPAVRDGQMRRVQVTLGVSGHVLHKVQNQPQQTPIRVDGSLAYHEKLVAAGDDLAAIRYYDKSVVKMRIDGTPVEPSLRDSRRLIIAHPSETGTLLFSPAGTLQREELDMLDVQGSTLALDKLLPGRSVKSGQTWKPKNETLAELLVLDKLTHNAAVCKLEKVESGVAHITLQGQVGGSVDGALTEITLKGTLGFHVERQHISWITLDMNESRSGGPAGPGVKVAGKLRITISPLIGSEHLSDAALADVSIAPSSPLKLIRHDGTGGRFRTWHDRRWHVIDEREQRAVLRMIGAGQRIAQCNITLSDPPADKKETMTLAKFRGEVEKALNQVGAEVVSAEEYKGRTDHKIFGLVCKGEVSGVPIAWHYYHVTHTKTGHRATLVVTAEQSCAAALRRSDLMLARSMQLLAVNKDDKKDVAKRDADKTIR